jgi:hypothetical protein
MPKFQLVYRGLICSPSDVANERNAIDETIASWNAHTGSSLDARIEAVRWERHAVPEMGAPPQEILNRQLVEQSDFGIAVFWSRVGTPTAQYESGSVEEIQELLRAGKRVMVYFSNAAVPQDRLVDDQFARLRQLRAEFEKAGILATFGSLEELKLLVNLHLTSLMAQLLLQDRAGGQPIPASGTATQPTPNIQVVVNFGAVSVGPLSNFVPVLIVEIQNHSPIDWFFAGLELELETGERLVLLEDFATRRPIVAQKLEPGNAISISMPAAYLLEKAGGKAFTCAVAKDKLERRFRSKEGQVQAALRASKS